MNLDSTAAVPANAFSPLDPTTFNTSTSTTTYDSKGVAQTTTMYFVNASNVTPNTWNVFTTVQDTATGNYLYTNPAPTAPVAPSTAPVPPTTGSWVPDGALTFTTSGTLAAQTAVPPGWAPAAGGANGAISFTPPGASLETIPFTFTGSTQFGTASGVNSINQDGYTAGQLSGFSVGTDGIITGKYSNGQSNALGQVVLATFPSDVGLQQTGGNAWVETAASGTFTYGAPGTGNNGVLQTSATEDSNVDLTTELVNMMTAQRYYQANAQTIKTQDSVMQTLINMR
jgi:flagellar hook protein FlgE